MQNYGGHEDRCHAPKGHYDVTQAWQAELNCQTFGLRTAEQDGTLVEVADISADRSLVEAMAQVFEREELEPVHLQDVVEDILADEKFLQEVWKIAEEDVRR